MKHLKKILVVVLIIMLFVPVLTACGPASDAHINVKTSMSSFALHVKTKSEDIQFLFQLDKTMSYNSVVENRIGTDKNYTELRSDYEPAVKLAVHFVYKNYEVFAVAPRGEMTDERTDSYNNFEKAIKEFQSELDNFVGKKTAFEQSVESVAEGQIANQKLLEFKRNFSSLIEKSESVFNSFERAYSLTYTNLFSNDADMAMMADYYAARLSLIYHSYAFAGFDCIRYEDRITFNKAFLQSYISKDKSFDNENREENMRMLTNFVEVYLKEEAMVQTALKELNLREIIDVHNGKVEVYKNSSPDKKAYYEKVESFFNVTVPELINFIIALEI